MHSARYLLMLNPASPSYSVMPRGGKRTFGWEDISAALSMGQLDHLAYNLARAKYCHDPAAGEQATALLQKEAIHLAAEKGWKIKPDMMVRLAKLACTEAMSSSLCNACEGRGHKRTGRACEQCRGSGHQPISDRSRYRFAAIDKRNWERRWKPRYELLFNRVCEAEQRVLFHLSRQLGR